MYKTTLEECVSFLVGRRLSSDAVTRLCRSQDVSLPLPALLLVVERMSSFMEAHGLVEGIFRLSASSLETEALALLVAHEPAVVTEATLRAAGAITTAACLKRLLGAAKEPLLVLCAAPVTPERVLAGVVDRNARAIVHRTLLLLHQAAATGATRMDASSLSTCVGPPLFQLQRSTDAATLLQDTLQCNSVVRDMIQRVAQLFPLPYERTSAPFSQALGLAAEPMSDEQWAEMLSKAKLLVCDRGDKLIEQGASSPFLYRVHSGTFDVFFDGKQIASDCGTSTTFGELSLLELESRSLVTAKCSSNHAEVWQISADFVRELYGGGALSLTCSLFCSEVFNPTVAMRFWQHIARTCASVLHFSTRSRAIASTSTSSTSAAPTAALQLQPSSKSERVTSLCVARARLNALWGSLVVTTQSVAHHGSLLGLTRSVLLTREMIEGVQWERDRLGPRLVLLRTDGEKPTKFFLGNDVDVTKVERALEQFLTQQSLDQARMDAHRHSAAPETNPMFVSYVVGRYSNPAHPLSVECNAGDRVIIVGRERDWYWVKRTEPPLVEGWIPAPLVAYGGALAALRTGSNDVLQKLLQTAHERELAPDEVLLSQNDASHTGTSIFIVASGFCIAKHGQLTVPLYQDALIGEISFLLGGGPTATVVAASTGASVYELKAASMKSFLEEPSANVAFFTYLCHTMFRKIQLTLEQPEASAH